MKAVSTRVIFTRVLTWILLIQVVNLSIDPTDPMPAIDKLGFLTAHEDLSINDIESIYELVSEQCLGVDVPEQDDDDESRLLKIFVFYFSESSIRMKPDYFEINAPFTALASGCSSVLLEHTSPPPRQG
jgi:hypothetical protein